MYDKGVIESERNELISLKRRNSVSVLFMTNGLDPCPSDKGHYKNNSLFLGLLKAMGLLVSK